MATKVAFVKDRTDGEIVAVFPEEPHSYRGTDVVSYVHMGQHGSCDLEWAREQDEPTVSEVVELFNELVDIGYVDLKMIKL